MTNWLHTVRWKNLVIIWICIVVIVFPHYDPIETGFFEFILWGIVCSTIAAVGNVTNDLLDVKQDKENKKKNIFTENKNKKTAYLLILILIGICCWAIISSRYMYMFSMLAIISATLLLLYNVVLKKIAFIGNLVIAILTSLIFIGVDLIVLSRLIYFEFGFENKQIELLACFAFVTTLIREIIKDAEDRRGDSFAGLNTLAKFMSDRSIAILAILLAIAGSIGTYYIMSTRQSHFSNSFYLYAGWCFCITVTSAIYLFGKNPSKYTRATRIIKGGMLGCLIIYLFLSL